MSKENVILVDEKDNQVGLMPKLEAHQKGLLHRAFSVFIFNSDYELLLQKRASSKYHSGGLWTNTCCSHPRDGEDIMDAANRRLHEEMGIKTNLRKVFDFWNCIRINMFIFCKLTNYTRSNLFFILAK